MKETINVIENIFFGYTFTILFFGSFVNKIADGITTNIFIGTCIVEQAFLRFFVFFIIIERETL